uniref:Alpha-amylase n=2 Tax=Musca domestica TaxID=7370 RepID=A4UUI1_MUSDO|nr:alpha-amylase [Musca domestica]
MRDSICSFSFVFVLLILALCWAQKDPQFHDNRTTIVHLFEWTWPEIARECEEFLGPQGYGGVQISPPNEVIVTDNWWARYQPVSYKLISRSGSESDLSDMIRRCNQAGVRTYVDIVVNHMSGYKDGDTLGTAGSVANYGQRSWPAVPYGPGDFHPTCDISNYQDRQQVRNCQLSSLADLNQTVPHVRDMIVGYMDHLTDLGVAGFRIDAAKHMWPEDLEVIYGRLKDLNTDFGFPANTKPYIYQEVIDLGGEEIKKSEYNHLGAVTEFKFSTDIGLVFRNKIPLKSLKNWGPEWNMLPSEDVIVFVDNHDNQRGHGAGGADILTHKVPSLYKPAVAFMLAHPYGKVARVMSSYAFDNSDQGPPAHEDGSIKAPSFLSNQQCDTANNGWVCEHRWPEIVEMVKFRNLVNDAPLENWWDNEGKQVAFSRGNKGFVAFNLEEDSELDVNLSTGLAAGEYCDVISGGRLGNQCGGVKVVVTEDGSADIKLPKGPQVLAISSQSKLQ